MSVKQTHYAILGYRCQPKHAETATTLSLPEDEESQMFGDQCKLEDLVSIYDGMNGQYYVFGRLIAEGDECDGIDMKSVSPATRADIDKLCRQLVQATGLTIYPHDIKYHVFTHFS